MTSYSLPIFFSELHNGWSYGLVNVLSLLVSEKGFAS